MSFKFAFVTDTHLHHAAWSEPEAEHLEMNRTSEAAYLNMIRQLNAFEPEFVIHGGDLVSGGGLKLTPEQFSDALDRVKLHDQSIVGPCHYVPGNHDVAAETGSKHEFIKHFGAGGLAYRSFVCEGLRFILLDTQELPQDQCHGRMGAVQVAWFRAELQAAQAEGQQALIFAHHLLITHSDFLEGAWVDNHKEVTAVLDEHDHVLCSFHGHWHENRVLERRGMRHAITAGINRYPMMWRKVFVTEDQVRVESCQLELPDLVAKAAERAGDNWERKLGTESDRTFRIPRNR